MDPTLVGMSWLHQAAIVTLLGYYAVLATVLLPALERSLDGNQLARAVGSIGRRSRVLAVGSVVMFLVTGTYLLVTAGRYHGLGNLFASSWTTLITVKHLVVLVMLMLAVAVDRLAMAVSRATSDEARRTALGVLHLAAEGTTALGLLVLLLTAAAQTS